MLYSKLEKFKENYQKIQKSQNSYTSKVGKV